MNKKETAEIKKNFSDKSGFFIMERVLTAFIDAEKNLRYHNVSSCLTMPVEEHDVYDETLKKVLNTNVGKAIAGNSGFVAMDWRKNLDDELVSAHRQSFFFTTMFTEPHGGDGDIATFFLKVPDDAQPGTVYNIGFYYKDSDMFRDLEGDLAFEKYAFTHMTGGTITVR